MLRYITAMSTTKSDIRRKLIDASEKLTEHLIKLYLFPGSIYASHWKKEIYAFLHVVPKLKQSNKLPSASFIFDCLATYLDQCDAICYAMEADYSELTPIKDISRVQSFVESYLDYISTALADSGVILQSDIVSKLDELLDKYN